MWEFNPDRPRTLKHFFGTTHKDIRKKLCKARKNWTMETEDIRLDIENLALMVSVTLPKTYLIVNSDVIKNYISPFLHRARLRKRSRSTARSHCQRIWPLPS